MGVFSPGGSTPLTGTVSTSGNKTLRHIGNTTLGTAGTESTITVPSGAVSFALRVRGGDAQLQIADTSGASGTIFELLRPGCVLVEEGLALSTALDLFIQSNKTGSIVELVWWT